MFYSFEYKYFWYQLTVGLIIGMLLNLLYIK